MVSAGAPTRRKSLPLDAAESKKAAKRSAADEGEAAAAKKKTKKSKKVRVPSPPLWMFPLDAAAAAADDAPRKRSSRAPVQPAPPPPPPVVSGAADDDDDDDGVEIVFATVKAKPVAVKAEPIKPVAVVKAEPVKPVAVTKAEPVAKAEPIKMELPIIIAGDLGVHSFHQLYMRPDSLLHPLVEYHGGVAYRRRPQLTLAEPSDERAPPNAAERERLTNDGEERRVHERDHDVSDLADAARAAAAGGDFATRTLWRKARTGPTPPLLGAANVHLADESADDAAARNSDDSDGDGDGFTTVDEFIIAEFSALTSSRAATEAANAAALEAASSVSHGPAPTVPQRSKKASKRPFIAQDCPVCGWSKATTAAMLHRHVNACLSQGAVPN